MTAFVIACGPVPTSAPVVESKPLPEEGCTLETSSKLANQHQVGKIRNLVKNKIDLGMAGRCTVDFDITVNGESYHLTETEEGLEQLESLCYYARERARENLLLDLGGTFNSEQKVSCRSHD